MNRKSEKGRIYITTTIPYVNAPPHIGHALEFVEADFFARCHRKEVSGEFTGDETYFLSGTDENAIKNVQAAEAEGIGVKKLVDRNSKAFRELLRLLNISVDQFIRTTEKRHFDGAKALWINTKKSDIYKKKYQGLYCVGCELFYERKELDKNGECYEHPGKKLELVQEENYFFKLSNYKSWLKELILKNKLEIIPDSRRNEVLSLIKRGLKDFSISRPIKRSKGWGVPVPGDRNQTMYVWYDALSNYITALGYPKKTALYKKFWAENKNRVHVLGKGVSRFHAIYWPAMLKSAGLPVPTKEFIHGYITVDGQKMGKSLGNPVSPVEVLGRYGTDATRYYLLRGIPSHEDGDFSYKKLEALYTADLANGLGNFAARVLTLGENLGVMSKGKVDTRVGAVVAKTKRSFDKNVEEFKLHEAVQSVWDLIQFGDLYINEKKPWQEKFEAKKRAAIYNLVVILDNVASLIQPAMPETSAKITKAIKWVSPEKLKVKKIKPLFPRLGKTSKV